MTVENQFDFTEKEIDESVFLWVEATLKNVPEHFKYFRDNPASEIAVFLPRYLRVRAANAMARVAGVRLFTEETLTEPVTINGWKIVDGYENLLVVCALRFAAMDPMYTVRIPIPHPSGTMKTTVTVVNNEGTPMHSVIGFTGLRPMFDSDNIVKMPPQP